ncbi:hypothetical protein BHE74_00044122 [Ensete ventricosum]|nr:hypothetical protein BHE74_00044122 [Ensete ventricosum]
MICSLIEILREVMHVPHGNLLGVKHHDELSHIFGEAERQRALGDSRLVAIISSSEVGVLGDFGTVNALATMRSYFNVDSTVTTHWLVEVRKNYFVPLEYELHAPLPGKHSYDAFPCGFSLSINALEAGLRFPLHPVIEACLEGWRISPSQIVPNSWRFPIEWTSRTVNNSMPALSADETKLVEIVRGILSASREMFNLGKMKFDSGSTVPSVASVPAAVDVGASMAEKRPNASGSTTRTSTEKGKGVVELEEILERGYTMQELCEVEDRAGADRYFASIMTWLKCVDSEVPLVLRWSASSGSSQFWTKGPLFGEYLRGALHPALANALIDRVHDAGRLIWSQHEKILTLRAANKELKLGANQELVATAKHRVKELEDEAGKAWIELEFHKNQWKELEQEVGVLCSSLDRVRSPGGDIAAFLEA